MSEVPINVFLYEDLDRDFVWAERKPAFSNVARPTVDQIQPIVITTERFELIVINDRGNKLKTYLMTVVAPEGGRININVQSGDEGAEWRSLLRAGELTYRVICISGTSDRALFGGPFTIETR